MTARRGAAGFTLLEVLVALAILGLAVVAAIQGFAQGLRLLKLAGDHQHAMLLADQKAREVVTPVEGQDHGTEGPFAWERTTTAVPTPELAVPGATSAWRVYQIAVQVRWDERRHVDVTTLRTASPTPPGAPGPGAPRSAPVLGAPAGTPIPGVPPR